MFSVIVNHVAEKALTDLAGSDRATFQRIAKAIDEIGRSGPSASNTKKLRNTNMIYRKRVGRWRVLFTVVGSRIDIWVVAIEKDTEKDYYRWISYITGLVRD